MLDLEQNLRQWRQEIEATLAFSSEEIDELEDHLRFSIDAKLKEGLTLENAWIRSLGELGSASALALEFAKDKLMPALGRLLTAWWRPALLLFLFGLTFSLCLPKSGQWILAGTPAPGLWAPEEELWGAAGLSLLATLIFLPDKMHKNAVLAGIGNALCLIPLLYVLFYNPVSEKIVGRGWGRMAASFGGLLLSLSIIGIFLLNAWWWKKSRTSLEKFPAMLAVAGTIIFAFTLSPFCSELIGHLSIRDLYSLPTAHQITLTGDARTEFLKFKFVDVLMDSMVFIENLLPFVLIAVGGAGFAAIHGCIRTLKIKEPTNTTIFPAMRDLPWIMTMISGGVYWVICAQIEPSYSERIRETERSIAHPATSHGGLEIVVLCSAALFFFTAYELSRRLRQSIRVRPFYASMLVAAELAVFVGITITVLLHNLMPAHSQFDRHDISAQPAWLSRLLVLTVLLIALPQVGLIWSKIHLTACATSIWKFDGAGLVQFGLLLGLIIACSGMILIMVALDTAYISVTFISALIAWGNSIAKPATDHFNPQDYGISDHLSFWAIAGLGYLSLCLAIGLGLVMILSALEFIRFNSFRLYKVRKARQGLAETLALNE